MDDGCTTRFDSSDPSFLRLLLALVLVLSAVGPAAAWFEDQLGEKETQAKRRPKIYLSVFNNGYSGDPLPQDAVKFEKLLKTIAAEGNFNAVLCRYSDERAALCKKHNLLMVVDLLATGHHVAKNPKECEELCSRLQGHPTIAAYHLWSDRFGNTGPGRARDIKNVHKWDPTHATWIGTYQSAGLQFLAESDFISYYDFAWKRGIDRNFPNLLSAWSTAKIHGNGIGRCVETSPGLPGEGNYLRSLYLQNTSVACGMKGCLWFIGSDIMDMNTLEFNVKGKDIGKVNAWTRPLWTEIPRLGLPTAIYSTPITKDPNNRDVAGVNGKPKMPPGLESQAIPKDFWLQPIHGEFVMGVFKYDGTTDAVYLANHNAYAKQKVKLRLTATRKPLAFDRQTGKYRELPVTDWVLSFELDKASGELILFPIIRASDL